MWGLCAEAAKLALEDAGLTKEDVNGFVSNDAPVYPGPLQEFIGIDFRQNHYGAGIGPGGSGPGAGLMIAAAMIRAGVVDCVMGVYGGQRDLSLPKGRGFDSMSHSMTFGPTIATEFVDPYGPQESVDNNAGWSDWGWVYTRHIHEYGTDPDALYGQVARQRSGAMNNPRSAFNSPLSVSAIRNSQYVSFPLRELEIAKLCAGAAAWVMVSPEKARQCRKAPVFLLGGGMGGGDGIYQRWASRRITVTAGALTAPDAYSMAGYSWRDLQFAQMYDCNTIQLALGLEDCKIGGMKKGDVGAFLSSVNTAWNGDFPVNTDGGHLGSCELNPHGASGAQLITEAVRQLRGEAENQIASCDLGLVHLDAEGQNQAATLILGSANAL